MNITLVTKWEPTGLIPKNIDTLRQQFVAKHLEAFTQYVTMNGITDDGTDRIHHAMIAIRNYCLIYDAELDIDSTTKNIFEYPYPSDPFVKK